MNLPRVSNNVIIKTLFNNKEDTTASGILKAADLGELPESGQDGKQVYNPSDHANRWGEVIVVPESLWYDEDNKSGMQWETEIEVKPGMLVWYDYLTSLNGLTYYDENKTEYKVVPYEYLYVAKEGDRIIPLNGYVLFERLHLKATSSLDVTTENKIDKDHGIVRYFGSKNKSYSIDVYSDDLDLQDGDLVLFKHQYEVLLEDSLHAQFDGEKMYRRAQRKDIDVVFRGEELILTKGLLLVDAKSMDQKRASGIELIRSYEKTSTGIVLDSRSEVISKGMKVYYQPGSGRKIEHLGNEYRILVESQILYYENPV